MRVLLMPALLAFSILLPGAAPAAGRGLGAGFMIGEPAGGTVKYWVDQDEAWALGAGVSFRRDTSFQVQADYLLHFFKLSPDLTLPRTPVYIGLGARINAPEDGDTEMGIRLPLGGLYLMDADRMELFVEVAPVLDLAPRLRGDFNCGIGLRFYGW